MLPYLRAAAQVTINVFTEPRAPEILRLGAGLVAAVAYACVLDAASIFWTLKHLDCRGFIAIFFFRYRDRSPQ